MGPWARHGFAALILFGLVLLWIVGPGIVTAISRLDLDASSKVAADLPPVVTDGGMLATIIEANGQLLKAGWVAGVMIVAGPDRGFVGRLEIAGALAPYLGFLERTPPPG